MNRPRRITPTQIFTSAASYPITAVYLVGCVMIWVAVKGWATVQASVIIFGIFAVLAIAWSAYREARTIHLLVDGQRTELLERIDQLAGMLVQEGQDVPEQGPKEQDARRAHAKGGGQ